MITAPPSAGGRQSEGSGTPAAPLAPHPVSRLFPPMTNDEYAKLRDDIAKRGLEDDIVLLDGQILDGNHRYRACTETGVTPRFTVWSGNDPVAYVLSKNLHRRQLNLAQKAAVAVEAETLYTDAAKARMLAGKKDPAANAPEGQKGQALECAAKAVGASRRSAQDAKKIKEKSPEVFDALKKGKHSVRSALKEAGLHPGGNKGGRKSKATTGGAVNRAVPEHVASQARIRILDAELKYQSMLNAPAGKLNIPLLDRINKIQELLLEVTGITPEKAVSGIPALRCREYSLEMAKWWLRFAELCEERRQKETPELPAVHQRPRLAALNPVVAGGTIAPTIMTPTTRAVYDWISKQTEPVTSLEAAVAVRVDKSTASEALRNLAQTGHAEIVGSTGPTNNAYRLYQFKPSV